MSEFLAVMLGAAAGGIVGTLLVEHLEEGFSRIFHRLKYPELYIESEYHKMPWYWFPVKHK